MVVEADEMQHTVDDDPMQLALIATPKGLCIFLDSVGADAKFTRKNRLTIGQRKGDDVSVKVVAKALSIDLQELLVTTEIVVQLPYRFAVTMRHFLDPNLDMLRFDGWHFHIQCAESNHPNACFSLGNTR